MSTQPIDPDFSEYYDPEIMKLEGVELSGLGDVIIPARQFAKFPWDKLDLSDSNTSNLSRGGHPLRDHQWTINFWLTNKDGNIHPHARQYRWCVPEGLIKLMDWCKGVAEYELQRKARNLWGLDR